MKFKEALEFALDGKAIMFAGAGYAYGATNIKGEPFKRSDELARYFSKRCNLPEDTSLDDAAECFVEEFNEDALIEEIQREFTVKDLASFHEKLAAIPWKRIYTTNYDNILELSWSRVSKKLTPITLSSDIYKIPKKENVCIHLNGFVDQLNRDTIHSELKLTESSYLTASLADSEWIAMFRNDIKLAKAIFFLGYSLYDIDIKKILFNSTELKDKCFFIIGQDPDVITLKRVERFGTPAKKSVESFEKDVAHAIKTFQPSSISEPFFLSIREFTSDSSPVPITDQEFINLLLYGDVKRDLLLESLRSDKRYILKRDSSEDVFNLFDRGHHICLASSELGNGKSLLLETVNYLALRKGFRVFNVRERNEESIVEFQTLLEMPHKILITIDGYQEWLDEIKSFSLLAASDKYLFLTARNALHDVLYDDLVDIVGKDYLPEIQIDNLNDDEIFWFVDGFTEYGLWGEKASNTRHQKFLYLKNDCQGQIHSILLKYLNSPDISNRLKNLYTNIKDNPIYYEIVLSIFILTAIDQVTSIDTLVDLWGTENLSKIRSSKKSPLREVINFDRNYVKVKSSIVSEYFLRNISDVSIIVKVLLKISNRVHELSNCSIKYNSIFKSLMRFSNVQRIFPEEGRKAGIMKYYEAIKTLRQCRTHPLFWLQYAIAAIVVKDLYRAQKYFDSAYSYAENMNWDTFQIDNHYARYLLVMAIEEIDDPKEAMENFRRAKNIVNRQMANERLHYPYRVASLYQPFFDKFSSKLQIHDISLIKSTAQQVLQRIKTLPDYRIKGRNIRECRLAVESIIGAS